MGFVGFALGMGGFPDEAIAPLRCALRASPHDPMTWLWTFHSGIFQFYLKDFDAALATMRQVLHLRPGFDHPHIYIAASLGYLGRVDGRGT